MRYELSISERKTYVYVRVYEPITKQFAIEFLAETAEKAKEYTVDRFLFDVRSTLVTMSIFDIYWIAYKHSLQLGFERGSRIAVLQSSGNKTHDFIETVALNAGYICRLFEDKAAAVRWLEQRS